MVGGERWWSFRGSFVQPWSAIFRWRVDAASSSSTVAPLKSSCRRSHLEEVCAGMRQSFRPGNFAQWLAWCTSSWCHMKKSQDKARHDGIELWTMMTSRKQFGEILHEYPHQILNQWRMIHPYNHALKRMIHRYTRWRIQEEIYLMWD